MAGANSNIQLTSLDFDGIKSNFKTFLQSQDTFKDYNFEGSAMSVLLDVLAYNTQYNAYYLNMVGNEMFLDTATQRKSVVSHAKLMNYTPKSAIAPSATVSLTLNNVGVPTVTIPAYMNFLSETINGVNYVFTNPNSYTTDVNLVTRQVTFDNVELKQGVLGTQRYTVDSSQNPKYVFSIPDATVDTTTLKVTVWTGGNSTDYTTYNLATNDLYLDGNSNVYFLQESLNGNYEIYFGDGILGKKLSDGNIVRIDYLSTEGTAAAGANNFVLMDSVGYSAVVTGVYEATSGSEKESVSSIKFHAPKAFAAQGRAVTKEDYINAIQSNNLGYAFDSVSVWGGQENETPVYGQVFISMKPAGAYNITATQKQRLINDVLKPISVLTVEPTIVDPDYTYIKINTNVVYDQLKTSMTASQVENLVRNTISSFATRTLNTFNSTFLASDLNAAIKSADNSIVTAEFSIELQKKFFPNLSNSTTYKLYYGAPLKRGMFTSGVKSSVPMSFRNPSNLAETISNIYLEELPTNTGGIDSFSIVNAGFGYQYAPTVTIKGDGTGATARAIINTNGTIRDIVVVTPGTGYTSAIAIITPAAGDTTGQLGSATVSVEGKYGTLRLYYNNTDNVKTVFNNNIGTIDYAAGIITLNSFNPIAVNNEFGQLGVSVAPVSSIISSSFNRIITVDPYDASAIVVTASAKK